MNGTTQDQLRCWEKYTPGDDLKEQIEEYRGVEGKACPFVQCQYKTPDFKVLDEDQLRYYLYFRDAAFRGENVQSDLGYAWLLYTELINDTENPERSMGFLLDQYNSLPAGLNMVTAMSELVAHLAISSDMDLPQIYYHNDIWRKMLLSEVLLPAPKPVEPGALSAIVGLRNTGLAKTVTDAEVLALFNAVLSCIDSKMRESTGKGVMDTFGLGERTENVKLFDFGPLSFMYFGGKRRTVTFRDSGLGLESFLGALFRYCTKVMERENGGKGPQVPSSFGKDLRRLVDEIYNHGDISAVSYPERDSRGSVRGSPDNGSVVPNVVRYRPKIATVSGHFKKDLGTYALREPTGPCEYVPSGYYEPEYRRLSPESLEYYLYWRGCARQGIYGTTDRGYLWLYMCELINVEDVDVAIEQLAGLARAYDGFFDFDESGNTDMPCITYMDLHFVNGLRIRDPTVGLCMVSSCDMMDAILEGDDVPVCKDNFIILAQPTSPGMIALFDMFDDDCAHVVALTLRRIQASGGGGTVTRYCDVSGFTYHLPVFGRLRYYRRAGGRMYVDRVVTNYMGSQTFRDQISVLMKLVINAIKADGRKLKPTEVFGVEASGFVLEAKREWSDKKARLARIRAADSMVLDPKALDAAMSDLDSVTEMMRIDESETVSAEPEPASDVRCRDHAWADFARSLDKDQAEYMRGVLSGTLKVPKPVMEDSINVIAMDTVGDTVVEDGRLVEEYAVELSEALATR